MSAMKKGIFAGLLVGAVAVGLLVAMQMMQPEAEPLGTYWQAPVFSLTNQAGDTLTNEDLNGQVWVSDFFFTSCPAICPILLSNLQTLHEDLMDEPWRDEVLRMRSCR